MRKQGHSTLAFQRFFLFLFSPSSSVFISFLLLILFLRKGVEWKRGGGGGGGGGKGGQNIGMEFNSSSAVEHA